MFLKKVIVLFAVAGMAASCTRQHDTEDEGVMESPDTIKTSVLNVGGELFSVPSPMQMALLIQKTGHSYDKSMLNATNRANTYLTDDSRALNLGVYGADLGYVSLYSQSQDAIGYLASLKQLSDKLGLTSAFDERTLKRIRDNVAVKDSMLSLVSLAYRASDAYLKDNDRATIGTLILAGGWIESMHFALTSYKAKPTDQFRYRIAQQKQALSSILKILGTNESAEIKDLHSKLEDLSRTYDKIEFKYTYEEPRTDSAQKVTYINSSTEIKVTDQHLAEIAEKIAGIRSGIINTTEKKAQ
jgi:hypothetical protein